MLYKRKYRKYSLGIKQKLGIASAIIEVLELPTDSIFYME